MDNNFKEISRRATKGDEKAMKKLFSFAETLAAENQFEEAAIAFRDAAIAYRIADSRNKERAEDAEDLAAWLNRVPSIYQRWLKQNPKGFQKLPYNAMGITHKCINRVVIRELLREESFAEIFVFLQEALSSAGMKFSSPGCSAQRNIWLLVAEVFDLSRGGDPWYLRHMEVRIGVDLLADEVAKRCRGDSEKVLSAG